MQDKLRFCESCRDIRREFTQYCWNDSAHGDAPRKEHDHAMDDMRYFVRTVGLPESGRRILCGFRRKKVNVYGIISEEKETAP